MKKVLVPAALLLSLILLFSSFPAFSAAGGEVSLAVTFANGLPGDGEGSLTVSGVTAGTYRLYFVDENGSLPGYEPIVEQAVPAGSFTFDFPRALLLPPGATGIGLYTGLTEIAVCDIPAEKRLPVTGANFTFASVSDVHMNLSDSEYGAKPKWTAALNFFDEMAMDAVIVSGDLTGSGTSNEYERYRAAVEDSTYDPSRIYEAQGNHDSTQVGRFLSYTQGVDDVHPFEGSAWFYVLFEGEGDERDNLFIFMAQELSGTSGTPTTDNFSTRQLDWVEGLLETYAGTETNIFLVEHSMIYNFGPGDKRDGAYAEPMYFNNSFPGNIRFKSILTEYKEMIMMAGHTHLTLRAGYNFGDENGTAARMIHNSSTSQPRCYTASGAISYNSEGRTNATNGSEGYLVYVYDEYVTYVGYDLTEQSIIPAASYLIPLYSEDRSSAVSISVTVPPAKTEYVEKEWFDATGMVVTATYADGSTAEVKGWGCSNVGELSPDDAEVLITYGGCAPVPVAITVSGAPSPHGAGVFEGSGTAEDPFLISTPADFAYLTDLMNACTDSASPCGGGYFYKQTADIDMTGYEGYDGTHVLNDSRKVYFGGVYDGAGHTINVDIVSPGQTSVFPYISGAILNLKITGSIDSGVAATTSSAQPIRTMSAGSVIANCVFDMTLTASIANGVCYSSYGTMFNVFATGVASGERYSNAAYRTNSGGSYYHVFTDMQNAQGGAITHSTCTASNDLDAIAAAFNDREDDAFVSGLRALTMNCPELTAEALGAVNVANGALVLSDGVLGGGSAPTISGSGTKDDPYLIDSPDTFMLLTDFMNASTSSSSPYGKGKYFLQTADIDMTGCAGYDGTHVLNDSRKVYFGGVYNGGGHTITVDIETEGQTAVFPYLTGALLNLKIVGSIVSPTGSTGSGTAQPIRAVQAGAVVANCVFEMTLSGAVANGVCYSLYGTVMNVYATGVATKAVYTTNTGTCLHVFNNVTNASGKLLTHSTTTSTSDLDVIAEAFNDRESDAYASGLAALRTLDETLTDEVLLPVYSDGERIVFGLVNSLAGDVNNDGLLSVADVSALLDALAGPDGRFIDLNGDGSMTVADVSALLDVLAAM